MFPQLLFENVTVKYGTYFPKVVGKLFFPESDKIPGFIDLNEFTIAGYCESDSCCGSSSIVGSTDKLAAKRASHLYTRDFCHSRCVSFDVKYKMPS